MVVFVVLFVVVGGGGVGSAYILCCRMAELRARPGAFHEAAEAASCIEECQLAASNTRLWEDQMH